MVAHWQLARDLQSWTSGNDIKIYTSSRPHSPFLVTFAENRNFIIHLHEFNRRDIYLFSRQIFEKDPNFKEIQDSYFELVIQIVEMSEGVFLWAWLVVRMLLSSIGQLDEFHVLKQKLNAIPKGLDELYEQLLGAIGENDRCRLDEMLLLTLLNPFPEPLNVQVYGWLDNLKDPHFPPVQAQKCFSEKELETRRHRIQRQLDGLTKGLLEVTASNRRSESSFFQWQVQFFYLTVRDFLRSRSERLLRSFLTSDPAEWYGRLRLAEFVYGIAVQNPHTMTRNVADPSYPETFLIESFKYLGCSFGSKWWIKYDGLPLRSQLVERFTLSAQVLDHRISVVAPTFVYPGILRAMWSYGNCERSLAHMRGSLLHLAAYYDLQQCISYEDLKNLQLLKTHDYTSILYSAVAGRSPDLVTLLLEWGASPQDTFSISHRQLESGWETRDAPIWIMAVVRFLEDVFTLDIRCCTILDLMVAPNHWNECFLLLERVSSTGDLEIYVIRLGELVSQHKAWQTGHFTKIIKLKISGLSEESLSRFRPWLTTSVDPPAFAEPIDFNEHKDFQFKVLWVCWRDLQLRTDSGCRIW